MKRVHTHHRMPPALAGYGRIAVGCYLFAAAVVFCLEPHELAPGGVSGLAIVLGRFVPMETGTIILLLNLPLLWLGWRRFGKTFLMGTAYATVLSALFTNILDTLTRFFGWPALFPSLPLAALFGGILQAAGIGVIFREGATTGGTDIVVHLLHDRYHRLAAGWIFLAVDASVIFLAFLSGVGTVQVVYAILSLTVFSLVLNRMLKGT